MGTTDSRWWNGGEPIWVTARKQNLRSATFFWPGSEAEIRKTRPNIWLKYNESIPFETRVDKVVEWFVNENINMATLYLHEPDLTGHKKGPDSPEIFEKVKEMDSLLGYIVAKLEHNNLWDNMNVIVTSDHGMAKVDPHNKVIDIPSLIDTSLTKAVYDRGPIMQFLPMDGKDDELYNSLHGVHPNMTVYRKEDLPDFWHYKNSRRVMPIVGVADEGWLITMVRLAVYLVRWYIGAKTVSIPVFPFQTVL
jgi:ectonucleotide pyrophosphatase/phosphodiesterase family protein 5